MLQTVLIIILVVEIPVLQSCAFGVPECRDAKRRKVGRPRDEDKEAFQKMCSYLELNSEEQLTVASLRLIMKGFLSGPDSSEPYDNDNL